MANYAPSIKKAAREAGLTPAEYLARQKTGRAGTVSSGSTSSTGTVFAPSIKTEAAKQGLTPSEYLAQLEQQRGAGVQRGLDAVAPVFDPVSGDWYYVRAESIDGKQWLDNSLDGGSAYAPGSPVTNALNDMNVEHVPALGANGPQADGTWLNQQEVREQQQVIPGTTMETNFPRPGSSPGVAEPPRPEAPPAPEQPAPLYAMPGTTAPTLGASPGKGGQRATGLVTGSRNVLDVFLSPDSPGALIAGITLKPRR